MESRENLREPRGRRGVRQKMPRKPAPQEWRGAAGEYANRLKD